MKELVERPTPRTNAYGDFPVSDCILDGMSAEGKEALGKLLAGWGFLCRDLERELESLQARLAVLESEHAEFYARAVAAEAKVSELERYEHHWKHWVSLQHGDIYDMIAKAERCEAAEARIQEVERETIERICKKLSDAAAIYRKVPVALNPYAVIRAEECEGWIVAFSALPTATAQEKQP